MKTFLAVLARLSFCLAFAAGGAVASAFAQSYSPELKQKAMENDIKSQFELGYVYFYGKGVEKDIDKGLEWLEMAANKEYKNAQLQLGYIYLNGLEKVKVDEEIAEHWYNMAYKGLRDSYQVNDHTAYTQCEFDGAFYDGWAGKMDDNELYILGINAKYENANPIQGLNKNGVLQYNPYWKETTDFIPKFSHEQEILQNTRYAKCEINGMYHFAPAVRVITGVANFIIIKYRNWHFFRKLRRFQDAQLPNYEKKESEVLSNYIEEARIYGLIAERMLLNAEYHLGLMYLNGKNVAQDYSEAYIRFNLLALNAKGKLKEEAAKKRQEAKKKLTDDELTKAQAEVAKRLEEIKKKQAAQ